MPNQFTAGRQVGHKKETRDRIQAVKLIERLHLCVMGELELTTQQVAAAKTLLAKILPDLASTEMKSHVTERFVISAQPELSQDEWLKKHDADLH